MEDPSLFKILISWFPMLLLIAVWLYFMRKMKFGNPNDGILEEMKRQNQILERIAASIEKR